VTLVDSQSSANLRLMVKQKKAQAKLPPPSFSKWAAHNRPLS